MILPAFIAGLAIGFALAVGGLVLWARSVGE